MPEGADRLGDIAAQKLAGFEEIVELIEAPNLVGRGALVEMDGLELIRVFEAASGGGFGQAFERPLVEEIGALGLVLGHEGSLQALVLGSDAHRAEIGPAELRLDAAEGEHEAPGHVAPIGSERERRGHLVARKALAAGGDLDAIAKVGSHQCIVDQEQALPERVAQVVGELGRRGSGAAFTAIDGDEIRGDPRVEHGLANRVELPGVAHAELESYRLAPGEIPQLLDEIE